MEMMRDAIQEDYARMEEEDANAMVESKQIEMNTLDKRLQEAKAESEWQMKMVASAS